MQDAGDIADSLTGVWPGHYGYGGGYGVPDVAFTATLIEVGGGLSGTIHEDDTLRLATSPVLYALVSGSREGAFVTFTKGYDGTGGWSHTVQYQGVLSRDGGQITGTWLIPREATGDFVMIRYRPKAKAKAKTRKAAEPVEA